MTSPQTDPALHADAPPLLPECLTGHTSCVIAKVGQAVARLIDAELEALGLRSRHYQVLKTLADGRRTSQQALGSALRIDGATMVATIDDLEASRLVQRRRNRADRRSYTVTLTRSGRTALAQADRLIERLDDVLLGELSPADRVPLAASLERLATGSGLSSSLDGARGRNARS